jgi:hypothetical protein
MKLDLLSHVEHLLGGGLGLCQCQSGKVVRGTWMKWVSLHGGLGHHHGLVLGILDLGLIGGAGDGLMNGDLDGLVLVSGLVHHCYLGLGGGDLLIVHVMLVGLLDHGLAVGRPHG